MSRRPAGHFIYIILSRLFALEIICCRFIVPEFNTRNSHLIVTDYE